MYTSFMPCVCTYVMYVRNVRARARLQLTYVAMAILRKQSQLMILLIIAFVRGARDDYIFMSLVLFTISTT